MPTILICDKQVAQLINMSPSWVRSQRWKRKHNLDHSFTVDPIMIGTCPRYKQCDVENWIYSLEAR